MSLNLPLGLIILAGGCTAYCVRKTPAYQRLLAAWLLASAEADEARAAIFEKRFTQHRIKFGVPEPVRKPAQPTEEVRA